MSPPLRMSHRSRKRLLLRMLPHRWVTTSGPRRRKTLYLTFDDGPDPVQTPLLLDFLAEQSVRATFFLVGENVERHPALARRILADGHTLGNHSWCHPRFDRLTLAEQCVEIERTDRVLQAIEPGVVHPFRPPRGVITRPLLAHFVRIGRPIAYWSYDSMDYTDQTVDALYEQMSRDPPRPGEIVLLHDDSTVSLALLRRLLPEWKARGLGFDAMPARRSPATPRDTTS